MYGSPFDDYPYYDQPRQKHPDTEDRLRHVVYLDGRLIDTWTERVEGTAYHSWAQQLDRSEPRPTRPVIELPPPPHEAVLGWLDSTVGGRAALVALDESPLVVDEPDPEGDDAYADTRSRLERLCATYFDDEFLAATTAALATLHAEEPALLVEASAAEVAGGICWMVGRANGRVGAGTPVTQQVLRRELWLSGSPSRRVTKYKNCLRGLLPPPPHRPSSCPDLAELGSPAYLTSTTRQRLVKLRDRALAAAEIAAADDQARGSTPTDSLTP